MTTPPAALARGGGVVVRHCPNRSPVRACGTGSTCLAAGSHRLINRPELQLLQDRVDIPVVASDILKVVKVITDDV